MLKIKLLTIASLVLISSLNAQIFIQADPFYLLEQEKYSLSIDKYNSNNFLIRPFLNQTDKTLYGTWSVSLRTDLFFNDNAFEMCNHPVTISSYGGPVFDPLLLSILGDDRVNIATCLDGTNRLLEQFPDAVLIPLR